MSKHTPGPWTLGGPIGSGHLHGREPKFRVYAHRTLFLEVCADPDGYVRGENEANARLIAAAPDLLEACKVALGIIGFGAEHDQISAAIAKATGEQP